MSVRNRIQVGDKFRRMIGGEGAFARGTVHEVTELRGRDMAIIQPSGEEYDAYLLADESLWQRLSPAEAQRDAREIKPGDRFESVYSGTGRGRVQTVESIRGPDRDVYWSPGNWSPRSSVLDPSLFRRLPREDAKPTMPEVGRRVRVERADGLVGPLEGTVEAARGLSGFMLNGLNATEEHFTTDGPKRWTWEYIDDPKLAPAAPPPAPALLAHSFTDPYLTFVVRREDGSKAVQLLCKGCGAMNVGAVMATVCPGPRDWSADRTRGEEAHAFNTAQIDERAQQEREVQAELEKSKPRQPGPSLLHAGSLVGGPQRGAWRREGAGGR